MNNSTQNTNQTKTIIVTILATLAVACGGFGIFTLLNQKQDKNEVSKTTTQNTTGGEAGSISKVDNKNSISPVSRKTWSSQITNLKFSYSDGWSLTDEKDEYEHTVVLTKGEKKIRFEESEAGFGVGGCDSLNNIQFKRHGRTMVDGLSVVEESGSQNEIYVSTDTNLNDGVVKVCDTFTDGAILPTSQTDTRGGIYNSQRKPRISFYYYGDSSKLTTKEKAEVVEILSSLSLK